MDYATLREWCIETCQLFTFVGVFSNTIVEFAFLLRSQWPTHQHDSRLETDWAAAAATETAKLPMSEIVLAETTEDHTYPAAEPRLTANRGPQQHYWQQTQYTTNAARPKKQQQKLLLWTLVPIVPSNVLIASKMDKISSDRPKKVSDIIIYRIVDNDVRPGDAAGSWLLGCLLAAGTSSYGSRSSFDRRWCPLRSQIFLAWKRRGWHDGIQDAMKRLSFNWTWHPMAKFDLQKFKPSKSNRRNSALAKAERTGTREQYKPN